MAWPGRPPGTAAQVTTDCRSWHWHLVAGTNLEDSPLLTRAASPDGTASQASSRTPSPPGLPLEETQPAPSPGRKAPHGPAHQVPHRPTLTSREGEGALTGPPYLRTGDLSGSLAGLASGSEPAGAGTSPPHRATRRSARMWSSCTSGRCAG